MILFCNCDYMNHGSRLDEISLKMDGKLGNINNNKFGLNLAITNRFLK